MTRIVAALLLGLAVSLPWAAQAQAELEQDLDSLRRPGRTFLLEARDFGFQMFALAKGVTGFSDDQLYGVGVGVVAGVVISNALGLGWLLSTGVVISGGWIGKWIFDE